MMEVFIFIDPEEQGVESLEVTLDRDELCEILRCDATDAVDLPHGMMGYVDGEGAWQGRQAEWELFEQPYWGPMLVFKKNNPDGSHVPCDEEDYHRIIENVNFFSS